jgi:hypothetical protein
MKDKPFKPMLIAIDHHKQRNYDTQKTSFLAILSDFWDEAGQFIQVKNKNEFKGNFYNTFKQQFAETYKGKFPEIITLDKQMELASVKTDKLKFLSDKLAEFSDIEIDLNTNEIKEIDFGLYTSTENENKLLIFLTSLVDKIHEAEQFTNVHKGHLQQAFNNCIFFDHVEQKFKVNYYFITNQMR